MEELYKGKWNGLIYIFKRSFLLIHIEYTREVEVEAGRLVENSIM